MSFERDNLRVLEQYRFHSREEFQQHCLQDDSIVLSLRLNEDGLTTHHKDCAYMKNAQNNVELVTWPKYGVRAQDFAKFKELASKAKVPLFYECRSSKCIAGRQRYNLP
jgi:hypothetical protein